MHTKLDIYIFISYYWYLVIFDLEKINKVYNKTISLKMFYSLNAHYDLYRIV